VAPFGAGRTRIVLRFVFDDVGVVTFEVSCVVHTPQPRATTSFLLADSHSFTAFLVPFVRFERSSYSGTKRFMGDPSNGHDIFGVAARP
jgi:hypothetical protein